MITKELLMTMLYQNKRSIDAENHEYTKQILNKTAEKEPFVRMLIDCVSRSQAEIFCSINNLDKRECDLLSVMMQHIGGMVANAFISQQEVDELENCNVE